MPNIDKTTLQSELDTFFATIDCTTCIKDVLLTADAHEKISESWASSVPLTCDLPNMNTSGLPVGHLVFVDELGCHLVSGEYGWYNLDGVLTRQDIAYNQLYTWGQPWLFNGNTVSSPVNALNGITDWITVKENATAGAGIRGELGTSTSLYIWGSIPGFPDSFTDSLIDFSSGFNDWCDVSVGYNHAHGIRDNGTIWGWGCNDYGKIGNNSNYDQSSPVSVVGGFTDWCQVSAGQDHTAAVRSNGTLWTWGLNSSDGELGINCNYGCTFSSPVSVVGGFTDWCQVSVGAESNAAVRSNGTLWTWGSNYGGLLGDSTTYDRSSPVSVVGGFTDWCQVSAGQGHFAAVRSNGTLWTWGSNIFGQLGNNSGKYDNASSPVSVVGGFTDWSCVSSGVIITMALRSNGTLWGWGSGCYSKYGTGTGAKYDYSSPVSVVGGFTDWVQVNTSSLGQFIARSHGIRLSCCF